MNENRVTFSQIWLLEVQLVTITQSPGICIEKTRGTNPRKGNGHCLNPEINTIKCLVVLIRYIEARLFALDERFMNI